MRIRGALAVTAVLLLGVTACEMSEGPEGDAGMPSVGASDRGGADEDVTTASAAGDPSFPPLVIAPADAGQAQLVAGFETVRIDAVACDRTVAPGDTEPATCTIDGSSTEYAVHAVHGIEDDASLMVTAGPLPDPLAASVLDPEVAVGLGPTHLFVGDPSLLEAEGLETRAEGELRSVGLTDAEARECTSSREAGPVSCSVVDADGTAREVDLYPAIAGDGDPAVLGLVRSTAG